MKILEFLKEAHDEFLDLSLNITFEKTNPYHFNLMALYGTLIELTGCIIILLQNNGKIGIPSIFRTFLETYVEFLNLSEDPKYGYFMEASHLEQWKRVLVEAKKEVNPYLNGISKAVDLNETITQHVNKLESLKNQGYIPLSIFKRFEKAEMVDVYRSMYNFLSNDTHSNIRALIGRHAELRKNDFSVVFYKDEPIERFLTYIDSASGSLVDASIKIHEIFKSDSLGKVKQFKEKLQRTRKDYTTPNKANSADA
jgi:hypothetical protein